MTEWMMWVLALIASMATIVGVYKSGQNDAMRKNGYVKRENCRASISRIETRFELTDKKIDAVHEKANDTNEKVAKIQGYLAKHLN